MFNYKMKIAPYSILKKLHPLSYFPYFVLGYLRNKPYLRAIKPHKHILYGNRTSNTRRF